MSATGVTICQLIQSLEPGGAELLAARIARQLREDRRFVFVCLETLGRLGEELQADGFPVHVLDKRPGVDWRVIRRLKSLILRERIDVIHAHHYGAFFYGAMARLPRGRPPILLTEHGRHFPDHPERSHRLFNPLLLGRGDRLVGVGEGVRLALIDNEGFPRDRVGVIYNGIDTAAFGDVGRLRREVRHELQLRPNDFAILQAARLQPIKDHATAIRAMSRVAAIRGDIRLLVAGEGLSASEIDALTGALGLQTQVIRLGFRADVTRLLAAADLVLLSSVSEGIPLSLIEGMAAGLPVLATRVGGIPEVVEDGRTGQLVAASDDEAMAQQILRLAEDPVLREQMGQAGRQRANELFSEARMVAQYDRAYRDMATGRPVRAASGA
jgi:glycosyltransferase involved in cell wall biosynthesis